MKITSVNLVEDVLTVNSKPHSVDKSYGVRYTESTPSGLEASGILELDKEDKLLLDETFKKIEDKHQAKYVFKPKSSDEQTVTVKVDIDTSETVQRFIRDIEKNLRNKKDTFWF